MGQGIGLLETLKSDEDAVFDKEVRFAAEDIEPMITYGTNPGMGMGITQHIPTTEGMGEAARTSFMKSMSYMGFQPGEPLLGKKVDYVFWVPAPMGALRISVHLLHCERSSESRECSGMAGSGLLDGRCTDSRRGTGQDFGRGRFCHSPTGLLRLPGNERR